MPVTPIYSTRFIAHKGLDAAAPTGFIVPAGHTAVVRNADVYHGQNIIDADFVLLKSITGDWTWASFNAPGNTDHRDGHWEGRVVFTELEEFGFQVVNGLWDVTCSGYLFTNPS